MRLEVVSRMDNVSDPVKIEILDASPAHVRELKETIRAADRAEIESYGFSSARGIWRSYKNSLIARTALVDGRVAAVWGCGGTLLGQTGAPWLLTSYEILKISPLRFAREYRREVMEMLEMFPKLENFCLAEYHGALRLLSIAGFSIGDPEKIGNGMFRKFTMERGG